MEWFIYGEDVTRTFSSSNEAQCFTFNFDFPIISYLINFLCSQEMYWLIFSGTIFFFFKWSVFFIAVINFFIKISLTNHQKYFYFTVFYIIKGRENSDTRYIELFFRQNIHNKFVEITASKRYFIINIILNRII